MLGVSGSRRSFFTGGSVAFQAFCMNPASVVACWEGNLGPRSRRSTFLTFSDCWASCACIVGASLLQDIFRWVLTVLGLSCIVRVKAWLLPESLELKP